MRIVSVEKEDLEQVKGLLREVGLPSTGIEEHYTNFLKLTMGGRLIAVAGLEVHGKVGLLRSVAVAPDYQKSGLGQGLIRAVINKARSMGITDLYLLTEKAAGFFPRFGFRCIRRENLHPEIVQSYKLRAACCESTTFMHLKL
ncbi:MAG: GNAT family N-acetyltransferase [Firmicutes bacterium]|jgi:N-acetylglutamate synthase-like GNAT family acetyltransferase|nr:GNAT family N-acetyltransferase [Bacillota bacterium]